MPELLIELFSEEIPARMQGNAARDLERMARERLTAAGFGDVGLTTYAGPRRLVLVASDLPAAQADRTEEVKGPRVGAPPQAMDGFLKKVGLTQDALIERDGVYYAELSTKGRQTTHIIAEMVEHVVRNFPWPKSMKWGTCSLRWVRPLKRILCLFDGAVVPVDIEGIKSGDVSEGHRFMGPGLPFRVVDFADYKRSLEAHFVVLTVEERKRRIIEGARKACGARGFELVEDEGLLEEVAGLAEWPIPILGDMDPSFLDLPPEVIRTSMRTHQKYFAVRDPKRNGGLAPHFLVIANLEAVDGGSEIARGNAKVLSARLADARFFWDEDNKDGNFLSGIGKLQGVTFHTKLGTMAARANRILDLSGVLADLLKADRASILMASLLAKSDLVSGMVGEFPELQGVMGGYYSAKAGVSEEISEAIRLQYKPAGPSDEVPTSLVAAVLGLADRLDTVSSFFWIEEKPTGSRDPYALRRSALGIIRLILANQVRVSLSEILIGHIGRLDNYLTQTARDADILKIIEAVDVMDSGDRERTLSRYEAEFGGRSEQVDWGDQRYFAVTQEVLGFLADRLKVLLRDQGKRHDLVDAVFALGDDDLVRIVARVDALSNFLTTDDGANLLAGYKRAANILRAEEKKGPLPTGAVQLGADGMTPEEAALAMAVQGASVRVIPSLEDEDFAAAMTALAALRAPVDAFFDKVLVNSDVPEERANRLKLLGQVKDLMGRVADFSQISG